MNLSKQHGGLRAKGPSLALLLFLICLCLSSADSLAQERKKPFTSETAGSSPRRSLEKRSAPRAHFLHPSMWRRQGPQLRSGVRSQLSPAGILSVGEALSQATELMVLAIPEQLGGGLLFSQAAVREDHVGTELSYADSWASPLRPLMYLPFTVKRAFWGSERLILSTEFGPIGVDLELAELLPNSPGPPLIGLEGWQADDEALIAVGEFGVLLRSQDQGISWEPLAENERAPFETKKSEVKNAQSLIIKNNSSAAELWLAGQLKDFVFHAVQTNSGWVALLQGYGVLLTSEVTPRGQSYRIKRWLEPLAVGQECFGLSADYFYCAQTGSILSYADQFRVERRLGPHRQVLAQSSDALLLSGKCESGAIDGLCLIELPELRLQSLTKPELTTSHCTAGQQRKVLGYAIGSQQASFWELCDAELFQDFISAESNSTKPTAKKDSPLFSKHYQLGEKEEKAQLIESFIVGSPYLLEEGWGFWMAQGDDFFGVQAFADGDMSLGPLQHGLARASFAQERAFLWGSRGFAKESLNGGLSFEQRQYPHWPGDVTPASGGTDAVQIGCSALGCQLGEWLRLGWGVQTMPPRQALFQQVEIVSQRLQGTPNYRCDGQAAQASSTLQKTSHEQPKGSALLKKTFPNFQSSFSALVGREHDVIPPERMGLELSSRNGLVQLRAEGPRAEKWGAQGQLSVFYQTPFDDSGAVHSAITPGIFETSTEALNLLGIESGSARRLQAALDLAGRGGIVTLRTIDSVLLLRFNSRGILRYDDPLNLRSFSIISVLEEGHHALVLLKAQGQLRIWSLGSDVSELASFPLLSGATSQAQLVRDQRGELALFASAREGLVLYPITSSWQLGPPLSFPFLGRETQACAPVALGFDVDYESNLPPVVEVSGELLQATHLRQKLKIGYGQPCVSALQGVVSGALQAEASKGYDRSQVTQSASDNAIPLLLRDEAQTVELQAARCQLAGSLD